MTNLIPWLAPPRLARTAALAIAVLLSGPGGAWGAEGEFCKEPSEYCGKVVDVACLQRVGAGAISAKKGKATCDQEFLKYRDCLSFVASECSGGFGGGGGTQPPADASQAGSIAAGGGGGASGGGGSLCAPEDARQLWTDIKDSSDVSEIEEFAKMCANTVQGRLAANRARRMKEAGATGGGAPADDTALVGRVQTELRRVGFREVRPSGAWDRASEKAAQKVAGEAQIFGVNFRSADFLSRLRGFPDNRFEPKTLTLSGTWRGRYYYNDGRTSVDFVAQLKDDEAQVSGLIGEQNTFDNRGGVLRALVKGARSGDTVRFTKTYDGKNGYSHSVQYTGTLSPNRDSINGRWTLRGATGTFSMQR